MMEIERDDENARIDAIKKEREKEEKRDKEHAQDE